MSNFTIIRDKIFELVKNGVNEFVIFPYGENGVLANDILKQCFDISPIFIIDNNLCAYNSKIKSIEYLEQMCEEKRGKKLCVLFASYNQEILQELENLLDSIILVDIFKEARETKAACPQPDVHMKVGRYSYGPLTKESNKIKKIGSFCSFAGGVVAVWNHQLDMVTNHDFIYESFACPEITNRQYTYEMLNKQFEIGNDVWLGHNVILCNGVKIGNGVRAAAGSVITKDVPDYAVVAGVPARIIKYRFNEEQIRKLNEIAWWDWPIEKIRDCYDDFIDIEIFLRKHYKGDEQNEM